MTKIRNDSGDITIDLKKLKKKKSLDPKKEKKSQSLQKNKKQNYEEILWTIINKLDNPVEMDKFLETHKPPKLTQEEISNISRSITRGWVSNQKPPRKSQTQIFRILPNI